jgi:hypothetical protein
VGTSCAPPRAALADWIWSHACVLNQASMLSRREPEWYSARLDHLRLAVEDEAAW